jgi:pyruvate ferredoxin oxidoreductase gamma subunit
MMIASAETPDTWRERLGLAGAVLTLPPEPGDDPKKAALIGVASVGAAARAIGVISQGGLEAAIRTELEGLSPDLIERNVDRARESFESLADSAGCVVEGRELDRSAAAKPAWVRLDRESATIAAPDIHGAATSERVQTGLWRTMRPEIDESLCNRCSWICSTFCPDGAIDIGPVREPIIDYDHCKGCLLCVAVCPTHAIRVEPEASAVAVQPRDRVSERPEAGKDLRREP